MPDADKADDALAGESLRLTAKIVAAYLRSNSIPAVQIPEIIQSVRSVIGAIEKGDMSASQTKTPAVPINKSITDDYIVCLEDGKQLKTLKRYLSTHYGLTPEDYRKKWGLPAGYPMVAPNYARRRSELAKKIGLGRPAEARGRRPARLRKKA